jgi:hypothetical protein
MKYNLLVFNIPVYTIIISVLIIIGMYLLIKSLIINYRSDPLYQCKVYRQQGCAHIDGYLCDYPKCDILQEHYKKFGDIR